MSYEKFKNLKKTNTRILFVRHNLNKPQCKKEKKK